MSNIGTYSSLGVAENPITYAKAENNTVKVQIFAKQLHDLLPVLQKEFDDLEQRNTMTPNSVFPIKMQALASIYQAAGPLYEWYVEKAKRY